MQTGLEQEQCLISTRDMGQTTSGLLKIIQREVVQPEVLETVRPKEVQTARMLEEQQRVNMRRDITEQKVQMIIWTVHTLW